MLSITRILFFFLGLTQYAVDGFVVGERNADARVSTIHHFPNNTVGVACTGPRLWFVRSSADDIIFSGSKT